MRAGLVPPTVDARLALAFTAALEIEEQACAVYASVIRRVGDRITKDPRRVRELALPATCFLSSAGRGR
jgi:hypothetical protein